MRSHCAALVRHLRPAVRPQHMDQRAARGQPTLPRPPGRMAPLGAGLVMAAKQGPRQAEGGVRRRRGQRQEQTTHFGHAQGNQV